jgi:sugar phosphate isomerase/epimerase
MQIGFVSAILADQTLEEVLAFAGGEGFDCVELMCWPPGGAERRYGGVTHLDVDQFDADQVRGLLERYKVSISALGYYPNPLHGDPQHRTFVSQHLQKVISAAKKLGLNTVTSFIGRDHTLALEAQWPRVREVWPRILAHAETNGVRLAIENCPMLYSDDEWPGGTNLAISPANWRRLFEEVPSQYLGLNFDPSHLVWLDIDCARCVREFGGRIYHAHAKDTEIDREKRYETGILGLGWHRDRLPGLGEVRWGQFFAALTSAGYDGPVCIEVEDRAYEATLPSRHRALRQSRRFLEQWVSK